MACKDHAHKELEGVDWICGCKFIMVTPEEFHKMNEDRVALERTRADLWGSNEELRNKIKCLEEGQLELQIKLSNYERPLSLADDLSGIASDR